MVTTHDKSISLVDPVALLTDVPAWQLIRGQIGTVVEVLAPGMFEVKLNNNLAVTYQQSAQAGDQLIRLIWEPQRVA